MSRYDLLLKSLRCLAGELNDELKLACPRVTALGPAFSSVSAELEQWKPHASAPAMHASGMMEAVLKTATA